MGERHEVPATTLPQFVSALLGGLLAPLLAIALIVFFVFAIQGRQVDAGDGAEDPTVLERIKPVGMFVAIDPNAPHVERSEEEVYSQVCINCHAAGALGAPKHKDKAAWAERLAKGYDTLLLHAMKGFNKMPPRGNEPDLTDLEVARGMVYMTNAAGADYDVMLPREPEPTAEGLARGKVVYAADCVLCHDSGLTGAPKLTDRVAWQELVAEGKEYLYTAAIKGSFGGPAKGGNDKLSDADVKNAVDYMVEEAKQHFQGRPGI